MAELPSLTPDGRYIVYSDDPAGAEAQIGASENVVYRRILGRDPLRRLLLFWPFARIRDRFDVLITQYIKPFLSGRQIVVVYDVLFESHPGFFPPATRWRNQVLVRRSARAAERVVTVSDYSRRAIAARYGIAPERIVVCPNAATDLPVGELPAQARRPFVLFVGRLEPRKNLGLLLDAIDRLGPTAPGLVVVGREHFGSAADVARLRASPNAVHLQDVDPATLGALYRHVAAFVFPSSGEGFGIPVLEALACGAPVVCSAATSMLEVAGPFARFFDPLGPTRLANSQPP